MTLWPRTLLARLLIIVLLGLLLANALSLTLVMVERMHSARTVMLGNLENDVATSVPFSTGFRPKSGQSGWNGSVAVIIVISLVPARQALRQRTSARGMRFAP